MSGQEWSLVILGFIGMIQVLGLALIQRGRSEDKKERKEVAAKVIDVAQKVESTEAIAVETKQTIDTVHGIVNSRYDELKKELEKSNAHVVRLLQQLTNQRRATDPGSQTSSIIASAIPPETPDPKPEP
jgi:hypothetical protein